MAEEMKAIDDVKLENELKKRGISIYVASEQIGYSRNALKWAAKRGELSRRALTGLRYCFNIDYEAIKPDLSEEKTEKVKDIDDEKKTAENANFAVLDINAVDWAKVELHIRRAVAAALQDRGL